MLSALAFSLFLASGAPEVLDTDGLKAAIQNAKASTTDHGAALNGRRFRISMPVRYGDRQNLKTYKAPARWRYDYTNSELEITIGLGEISAANYDQFDAQGLDKLPALQTTYFDVEERKIPTSFESKEANKEFTTEIGIRSLGASYGIATPYPRAGAVGFPKDFEPLMIARVKVEGANVNRTVDGMTMVVEGQVTPLAEGGTVFCGKYNGNLLALNVTGDKRKYLQDNQCFVTARIDRVSIYAGKNSLFKNPLLRRWGE
jgi:hypothetical protein